MMEQLASGVCVEACEGRAEGESGGRCDDTLTAVDGAWLYF